MSEVNPNEVEIQPIPTSFKLSGAALGLLAVLIIIWLITSSDDDSQASTQAKQFEVENTLSSVEADPVPINPLSKLKQVEVLSAESLLPIKEESNTHSKKLDELEISLEKLITENTQRQNEQDRLIQELTSRLTAQTLKLQQLQDNFKARQVVAKTVKKKKVFKKYRKVKPPFELVSIDLWGRDHYAVVRSIGRLHELTLGQSVNGWFVDGFNPIKQSVYFKNSRGTRRELFIQS